MISQCWTFLVVVLLVVAPGYGIVRALAPRLGRAAAFAACGPASIGIYYVVGLWLSLLHVPVEPLTLLPLAVAMMAAGVWAEVRAARWQLAPGAGPLLFTTAAATGLQGLIWLSGYGFPLANAGDNDGVNHGIFVYLIARTSSLRPQDVLLTDVPTGEVGSHFYPLGLHEVAAMMVRLGVANPSDAFVSLCVVLAAISLPWGMFALCRRMFPDLSWAGPVAALVGAVAFTLSYGPIVQGLFPLVVGLALAPGVIVVVVWALEHAHGRVLGVIALVGLFAVHSSEIALAVPGIACVSAWPWPRVRVLLRRVGELALMGVVSVILLIPVLAAAHVGASERYGSQVYSGDRGWVVGHIVIYYMFHDATVVALFGVVIAFLQRRAIPWVVLYVANAALILATTLTASPIVTTISAPWYSEPDRLAYNSSLLGLPLVGLAVAVGMQRVGRRDTARADASETVIRQPVAMGIGFLVMSLLAAEAIIGLTEIRHYSVHVNSHYQDGFDYLHGKVGPDQRVLNSAVDGSTWMLALGEVNPLVGAVSTIWSTPAWDSRWYMVEHAGDAATDSKEQSLLRQWNVRYLFVANTGASQFTASGGDPWAKPIDAAAAARSPAWSVTFRNSDVTIYRLSPAPGA